MLSLAFAQQSREQTDDEEIVRLSPFAVEERTDIGRYQAVESSSGSRIHTNLMDSPQSITVLTNEFIADIGAGRVFDALKYVAGIGVGSNPDLQDLMNVRGFLSGNSTIDGFRHDTWMN